jgi:hypothetical protein
MRGRMGGMRFSLAQLLWLTFWLAIPFSLWRFIAFVGHDPSSLLDQVQQMFVACLVTLMAVGLGAQNGRPKTGAVIGILVAMLAVSGMVVGIDGSSGLENNPNRRTDLRDVAEKLRGE